MYIQYRLYTYIELDFAELIDILPIKLAMELFIEILH